MQENETIGAEVVRVHAIDTDIGRIINLHELSPFFQTIDRKPNLVVEFIINIYRFKLNIYIVNQNSVYCVKLFNYKSKFLDFDLYSENSVTTTRALKLSLHCL